MYAVCRAAREPAQHIMGETHFYGLDILTDARALIPRSDSECVVTAALDSPVAAVLPGTFLLGGVVLDRPETHRRADLSYDSALLDLRGRFSDITGFDVEARHGN